MFENSKKKQDVKNTLQHGAPLTDNETGLTESGETLNPNSEAPAINLDNVLPEDLENEETLDAMFGAIKGKKSNDLTEQTSNYLSFEDWKQGEERGYIFARMTTFVKPDSGETVPAVILIDEDRSQWITAAAVVVGSLSKLDKFPCPVILRSEGTKAGKQGGKYYKIRVFTL